MVRHAEVFVVVFGGVGELQQKHQETLWMSWKLWKSQGRCGWGEITRGQGREQSKEDATAVYDLCVLWIPGTHVTVENGAVAQIENKEPCVSCPRPFVRLKEDGAIEMEPRSRQGCFRVEMVWRAEWIARDHPWPILSVVLIQGYLQCLYATSNPLHVSRDSHVHVVRCMS